MSDRAKIEERVARLRMWHELNAQELEGEEGEEDNYRFHYEAAETIRLAQSLMR